jgi:hypothetical protein
MKRAAAVLALSAVLTGCAPDMPEDVRPIGSPPAWGLPDSVQVVVLGAYDEDTEDLTWREADAADRQWLSEHGYTFGYTRVNEAATEGLAETTEDGIRTTDGRAVVSGSHIYVRSE